MLSSAPKSVPTTKQFRQPYFMDITPEGAILSTCTRIAELLSRRNIHAFIGANVLDIFPQLGKVEPAFTRESIRHGLPGTFDLTIQGSSIKSFVIRWIATPSYPPNPHGAGWQLTGVKIYAGPFPDTDRRRPAVDAALPETAANLIKQASGIIITTDLEHRIVYWNNAAERFYDIPASLAIGQSLRELIHYDFLNTTGDAAYEALRQQGIWEGEATYLSSAGKKSYLICSIRYVRDHNRQITGIMALNRDVTEVKLAQQDLTSILESITDGFFALDQHFRVTLWNHEAERITRLSAAEMIGQSVWDKLPELVGTGTWQSFHKAFKKKMTVTFEQYYERTDRWLEMSLYPSDQGVFAYFKEVTLRKKQEALLALEKKVLEMNTAKRMSLRSLLNFFLKGIQKIFPGMYCCVLTLDEDSQGVRLLSAPGLPASYAQAIDGQPVGPTAGSCGTAMFRKETVIVSDIATDPLWANYRDLTLSFGLRACWSIPVINGKGEVLAAFAVYYTTVKAPTDAEMNTFGRVANLVAMIIESRKSEDLLIKQELNKQKLVAQAMVDAQEKERAEIGKELHDNINQILSTTKLYLELAKNDHKERLSLINRSADNIHSAIHEIRNISRNLVPASIGDLGLQDSVADLVESLRTTRAIHVEFYPAGNFDEKISDKAKLMLFRIIQEQINNVLKHSGARNLIIELILEDADNWIELSITDDGKGFDPGKAGKKGLGLSNIMSRADLFGGKVTIRTAPGQGCKLRVQVPVI